MTSRRAKAQSIERTAVGFTVRDLGQVIPVNLSEIAAVSGTKIDKVTYEENYLVLLTANHEKVSIGELADGFAEFEKALCTSLNFPREWRVTIESASPGESVDLWTAK